MYLKAKHFPKATCTPSIFFYGNLYDQMLLLGQVVVM